MKHSKELALCFLLLVSCRKNFSDVVAKAEQEFAHKEYVDTIDTLNNGLALWDKSDGDGIKGHAFEILGKSYHQLRNTEKALEAFAVAVKSSTNTFDSALTMGNLYIAQNQPVQAEKSFRIALRMRPKQPLALLGLGNSLYLQRKNIEATQTFQAVIDNSPGVHDAIDSLAAIRKTSRRRR